MNFWEELRSGKWLPNTIAICSGVILYFLLNNIGMIGVFAGSVWELASPLVIGVMIAYLLDPLVKLFESRGFKRKPAVVMVLLVLLCAAVILMSVLIPQLLSGVLQFVENLEGYVASLETQIMNIQNSAAAANGTTVSGISQSIVKILDNIAGFFDGKAILSTSTSIGSHMVTYVVSFILAIYYLMAKEEMLTWTKRFLQKLLGTPRYENFMAFSSRCHRILVSYITCSLIEAILVAFVNLFFMLICRMPYAPMISLIVGVTNLAPTFGPIVGCIIGMFILLLVKPKAVIWFLLFTLVLQTLDGYVIKPKLFGDTLGVSSLLILIFLIMGGRLFGVWGILLAIPTAAILQYFCYEILFPITRKDYSTSAKASESHQLWPKLKIRKGKAAEEERVEADREKGPDDKA